MSVSLSGVTLEKLVDEAIHTLPSQRFPEHLYNFITLQPEIVLDLIPYFFSISETKERKKAALRCVDECLACIRHELDRKSPSAKSLLNKLEGVVLSAYKAESSEDIMMLNEILYNSELPLSIEIKNMELSKADSKKLPDIMPKLPVLLEQIRREDSIHNVFELHEFLMMNLFPMSLEVQLGIIGELATSNKTMPHELAVIMILHSKEKIRKHIPGFLETFVTKKVFNRIDLRRLIVIRNWLPTSERNAVDQLIKAIKQQGVEPAPYPRPQVTAIKSSQFDGAGAQGIIFEAKNHGKRMVGGFIVKHGVGIKDAWVKHKSVKGEFEHMCEQMASEIKPVSIAYVNKTVNHFLFEHEKTDRIPSPYLLQIAEIFGVNNWFSEPVSFLNEIERVIKKTDFNYRDKKEIENSFDRMENWKYEQDFVDHWFECGEVAEQAFNNALEKDKSDNSEKEKILNAAINAFILSEREKWKTIFLFMCLRARSKSIDSPLWKDLLILADQVDQNDNLKNIPVIRLIAEKSISTFMHRNFAFM